MRKDIHNSDVPQICVSCEARHRGICGTLSPAELTALAKITRQTAHGAGDELVGESQPLTGYANVMSGVVKLSKMLSDGRQQVVGLQFAPDLVGRLLAGESKLTAEAASDVELCRIPRPALEKLMAENPGLERKLMQQVLAELDEARDWIVTVGRKTAAEKVASFLMLIATHMDPTIDPEADGSSSFDLPLTRADIADFLGLTVETVSRQLTRLRSEKVIEIVNNRHVTIPDMARLRHRCG